ncbi:MAG: hypothetical protein LBD70_08065, partial [Bifidobacteriaceae bacterium]|nr:hypothetical protein [Bifidobacteriaceae bacterium]
MNRSANAIARHCGAALAVAVAVAALGPAGAADAVPTAPLILVAPALGAASPADPDVVAEAVSQALEDLPGDPIAVKPAAADAPAAAEAPLLDQSEGVAVLDAAPVGQAELSLDQAGGRVAVLVTDALATDDFSVAGVTWEDGPDPGRVLARAYQDDGWTEWFEL